MLRWEGKGEEEKGRDRATGKVRVEVDPKYYRPTEVVSIAISFLKLLNIMAINDFRTICKVMPPRPKSSLAGKQRLLLRFIQNILLLVNKHFFSYRN